MADYEHVAGVLGEAAQQAFHACAVHSNTTFHLAEFIPKAAAILRESFPERERDGTVVTEFYTWMGQDPHEMTKEALIGALGILGRVHLGQLEQAADMTKMWAALAESRGEYGRL